MVGPGPIKAASISSAKSASMAVGPALKAVQRMGAPMAFSKRPLARAYRAWACVMLGKNPSRNSCDESAPRAKPVCAAQAAQAKSAVIRFSHGMRNEFLSLLDRRQKLRHGRI